MFSVGAVAARSSEAALIRTLGRFPISISSKWPSLGCGQPTRNGRADVPSTSLPRHHQDAPTLLPQRNLLCHERDTPFFPFSCVASRVSWPTRSACACWTQPALGGHSQLKFLGVSIVASKEPVIFEMLEKRATSHNTTAAPMPQPAHYSRLSPKAQCLHVLRTHICECG